MSAQIQETATIGQTTIEYDKELNTQQKEWTIESLGIELEEEPPFTRAGFKKALKKASRKIKK